MVFVACGLNHKTAPINVREKVALSPVAQNSLLQNLLNLHEVHEAIILSTCNRTEIYCEITDAHLLVPWLAKEHQISAESLSPYIYIHEDYHALKHALRVASGLDSMMIGEPQILGQMKQAYQDAHQVNAIHSRLRSLFEYVFSVTKRVRTQSGIGTNPVSVAYAAVQMIGQLFTHYKALNVLLIGSGETASLVAKYLHQQGVHQFMVANRTLENAEKLAEAFGGKTIAISNLSQYLPQADVVITATACPIPFITKKLVNHALSEREQDPMFLLDLAVPRNIEADVADLEHIHLYNIDNLQNMIEKGMEERRQAALLAEELIETELKDYLRKQRSLNAKKVICDYRTHMEHLAQKELQRALKKLSAGHCQNMVLNEFSERLVNKLTHSPTTGLKHIARDGREDLFALAQYLFNTTNYQSPYEEIS